MNSHRVSKMAGIALTLASSLALAQRMPPAQSMPPAQTSYLGWLAQPWTLQPVRPPMERTMGRWLNNPELVERLGVNSEQKKKMEDIFQQYRLKLIDLNAALQKAEAILEPLVAADQPDEAKIVAQIDRVAQARAELEKANARMLLGILQVLTPEQWKKLQDDGQPKPRKR